MISDTWLASTHAIVFARARRHVDSTGCAKYHERQKGHTLRMKMHPPSVTPRVNLCLLGLQFALLYFSTRFSVRTPKTRLTREEGVRGPQHQLYPDTCMVLISSC